MRRKCAVVEEADGQDKMYCSFDFGYVSMEDEGNYVGIRSP